MGVLLLRGTDGCTTVKLLRDPCFCIVARLGRFNAFLQSFLLQLLQLLQPQHFVRRGQTSIVTVY